ncbi:MAG: hypothetical protein Q4G67_04910 [Actinomycetia bacterium]|nr:hypothetical protein [Actinomycetes bacterium]
MAERHPAPQRNWASVIAMAVVAIMASLTARSIFVNEWWVGLIAIFIVVVAWSALVDPWLERRRGS